MGADSDSVKVGADSVNARADSLNVGADSVNAGADSNRLGLIPSSEGPFRTYPFYHRDEKRSFFLAADQWNDAFLSL